MIIKDLMREIYTIESDKTFYDAIKVMVKKRINSVFAVDKDGKICGLINTRKLIQEVVPDYLEDDLIAAHFADEDIFKEDIEKAKQAKISDFMKKDIVTIREDETLMKIAALVALSNNQSRFPVLDKEGMPVGLVTGTELKIFIGKTLGLE